MSLTLYYHPLSSYCHKVLIALYEHAVEFDKRVINLWKPEQKAELVALWPIGKFPVLHDAARGRSVPESSIIIEYLDHHHPGSRPLIPQDFERMLQVRLWDRIFDSHIHTQLQAIVADHMKSTGGDMSGARATIETAYGMVDEQVASRTWIAGDDFSLADCAAGPALFYASTVVPFPDAATHLKAYFERLLDRPSFARALEEARPYFSMYPFAGRLPERYR